MLTRLNRRGFPALCGTLLAIAIMILPASCLTPPTPPSEAQVEAEIHALVNEERQGAGVATLLRDPTLDALARQYAASEFADAIPTNIRYLLHNSWRVSYEGGSPRLREVEAEWQVEYCLTSPDLSETMLRSDARATGVGVAIVGDTVYYTQVFNVLNSASGDGAHLVLLENPAAQDPTWTDVRQFVLDDDTDQQPYLDDSFVCTDFAATLHNRAEAAGMRAAYVAVDLAGGPGHALNAFDTTDRGLVYIDCTGQGISFAASGEDAARLGPISYDKVAYLSTGREYGLVSMERAASFDYEFYSDWVRQWEEYDSKVEAHSPGEATQEELQNLRLELEAIGDILGGYSWESPGTVAGLYVHW